MQINNADVNEGDIDYDDESKDGPTVRNGMNDSNVTAAVSARAHGQSQRSRDRDLSSATRTMMLIDSSPTRAPSSMSTNKPISRHNIP